MKLKKPFKIILFLIILGAGFYFVYPKVNKIEKTGDSEKLLHAVKPKKEVWPKVNKISLVATGDGLLHNSVYMDAYNKETNTFDFSHQLTMVKDIISSYDLAYYNQETVFGGEMPHMNNVTDTYNVKGYLSYPRFNSPSAFGDDMVDIGFNLVSLASNHSADCGAKAPECIKNSYDYWETKNVIFDGFNKDEQKENKHNIGEKNGIKYGFLAYTNTLNGLDGFVRNNEFLVDLYDEEVVKKEVEELKKEADVIIVAMHWHKNSAEYGLTRTQANKEIAEYLSSLGVNIILGTYSHSLQPFDMIGDTVVFYSLGNFISNQGYIIDSIGYKGIVGALASMDITKTEYEDGTKEVKVDNVGAELIYTYSNLKGALPHDFKVIPFSQMNSTYNKDYEKIYNDYSKVLTSLNDNIKIKGLEN